MLYPLLAYGFPVFSFQPQRAIWEGLKERHLTQYKFVPSLLQKGPGPIWRPATRMARDFESLCAHRGLHSVLLPINCVKNKIQESYYWNIY